MPNNVATHRLKDLAVSKVSLVDEGAIEEPYLVVKCKTQSEGGEPAAELTKEKANMDDKTVEATANEQVDPAESASDTPEPEAVAKAAEPKSEPVAVETKAELTDQEREWIAKGKAAVEQELAVEKAKSESMAKEIEVLKAKERKREFIEKAKAFDNCGEGVAEILEAVDANCSAEISKSLGDLLGRYQELAKTSELFKSAGASGQPKPVVTDDPKAFLEEKAAEIVKAKGITIEKARLEAYEAHPEVTNQIMGRAN